MINQQKTYTVYEHVNKVNGKRYIGTTSQKPEKRWGWKGSGYFNQPFWEAIKKYGWENFDHNIIAEGLSRDEAADLEYSRIREYDTLNPEHGYNRKEGGSGNMNCGYTCFTHS